MRDTNGRISGYGIHGDRRTKRQRTRKVALEMELICDNCGKRNAKQAANWKLLCIECRQMEDMEDEYGD